jgi:hypothetical protein
LWGNNEINGNNASDFINIVTAGSERMRIDSSGTLLIGRTDTTATNTGLELEGTGTIVSRRNNNTCMFLDRKTSEGTILEFRKDNSTVGSIGAIGGDLAIGTGDAGLRFYNSGDSIFPVNTSSSYGVNDNAIDLGYSGGRFKDLYLGGGLYVGGTGTANKLDDYEEGTWTPSFNFSELTGFSGSITTTDATYTKIGNFVSLNVGFSFPGSSGSLSVGDLCTVSGGLPFTQKGSTYGGTGGNFAFSVSNTANISIQPRSGGFRAFITSIVGSPTRVGGAMRITYNYQTT